MTHKSIFHSETAPRRYLLSSQTCVCACVCGRDRQSGSVGERLWERFTEAWGCERNNISRFTPWLHLTPPDTTLSSTQTHTSKQDRTAFHTHREAPSHMRNYDDVKKKKTMPLTILYSNSSSFVRFFSSSVLLGIIDGTALFCWVCNARTSGERLGREKLCSTGWHFMDCDADPALVFN